MLVGWRSVSECGKAWDQVQVFIAVVGKWPDSWVTYNYQLNKNYKEWPTKTNIANEVWFPKAALVYFLIDEEWLKIRSVLE